MDFEKDLEEITRSEFAQEIEIEEDAEIRTLERVETGTNYRVEYYRIERETRNYNVKGIFEKSYVDLEESDTAVLVESPRVTITFSDQKEVWERMKKDKEKFKIIHKGITYKMKNFDDDGEGLVVLYLEK